LNLQELGNEIRVLRKQKNYTQEKFAKHLHISRATLSKLENGYFGSISFAMIDNILGILGYEIDIKLLNPFIDH